MIFKNCHGKQRVICRDLFHCDESVIKIDMESVVLKEEDVLDRTNWTNDIQNHSGDPRWW